ncbi:MAG: hypothetical protein JXR07_09315 [Reichenbachiella sp.]
MKNKLTIFFVLVFFVGTAYEASAQKRNKYGYKRSKSKKFSKYSGGKVGYSGVGNPKYTTVGVSINATNYFGDLSPTSSKFGTDYRFVPDGFGLTASKVMYPGIFGRVGFNFGNITADDYDTKGTGEGDTSADGRYGRNYHFKNTIYELSAGFEIDLIPSNSGARGRFPVNPYLFLGVAGYYHSPKAKAPEFDQAGNPTGAGGEWVDLQSLGTEGQNIDSLGLKPYSKFQFAIPLGVGVKIKLGSHFDLNFEVGFRYLFTDHLDDVGGSYADLDLFEDNYLARAMSERGAEVTAAQSGNTRDTSLYGTGNQTVRYDWQNNDPNWSGGTSYVHGDNYVVGNDRASSENKDFYVMTQIRLVYILDKKGVSKGKFR